MGRRDGENYHIYRSCAGLLKDNKAIGTTREGFYSIPDTSRPPSPRGEYRQHRGSPQHLVGQNEGDAGVRSSQGESNGSERSGNSTPWRKRTVSSCESQGQESRRPGKHGEIKKRRVQNLPASARRTSTAGIAVGVDDSGSGPDATEASGDQGVTQPGHEHAAEDRHEVLGVVGMGTLGWAQLEYTHINPKQRQMRKRKTPAGQKLCQKQFGGQGLELQKAIRANGTKLHLTRHEGERIRQVGGLPQLNV